MGMLVMVMERGLRCCVVFSLYCILKGFGETGDVIEWQ